MHAILLPYASVHQVKFSLYFNQNVCHSFMLTFPSLILDITHNKVAIERDNICLESFYSSKSDKIETP